jgi:hypothetical protein
MVKRGNAPCRGFSSYRIRRNGKTYGCLTGRAGGLRGVFTLNRMVEANDGEYVVRYNDASSKIAVFMVVSTDAMAIVLRIDRSDKRIIRSFVSDSACATYSNPFCSSTAHVVAGPDGRSMDSTSSRSDSRIFEILEYPLAVPGICRSRYA